MYFGKMCVLVSFNVSLLSHLRGKAGLRTAQMRLACGHVWGWERLSWSLIDVERPPVGSTIPRQADGLELYKNKSLWVSQTANQQWAFLCGVCCPFPALAWIWWIVSWEFKSNNLILYLLLLARVVYHSTKRNKPGASLCKTFTSWFLGAKDYSRDQGHRG